MSTKRRTTEQFILEATNKHGNKYDYSKVVYTGCKSKVIIKCKIHGEFLQTPESHMRSYGCTQCSRKRILNGKIVEQVSSESESNNIVCGICSTKSKKTLDFIEKSIKKHGDKYLYDKVDYVKSSLKVTIICRKHGNFEQTPNKHLSGKGCSKCGVDSRAKIRTKSTEQFIIDARMIHGDRYLYENVVYVNANTKITIGCKIHGNFEQISRSHLAGNRCPKCATNRGYSNAQIKWLDFMSSFTKTQIIHAENSNEFTIPGTKFKADGFCKETNTIYEFHGDYWHGNPRIFNQNEMNDITKCTFGQLYKKTLEREVLIKSKGFNLVTIWENDWNNLNKSIKTLQETFRNNRHKFKIPTLSTNSILKEQTSDKMNNQLQQQSTSSIEQIKSKVASLIQACPELQNVTITCQVNKIVQYQEIVFITCITHDTNPSTSSGNRSNSEIVILTQKDPHIEKIVPGSVLTATGYITFKKELMLKCNAENVREIKNICTKTSYDLILEKLKSDGILSTKKKDIPYRFRYGKLAIISSENSSGLKDCLGILKNTFLQTIDIYHVPLHGPEMSPSIVNAIKTVNITGCYDLILIVRGGGAKSDLQYFDDYEVAKAIKYSVIPVITGIGHETDKTICDIVADKCCITPTHVGMEVQRISQSIQIKTQYLYNKLNTIHTNLQHKLDEHINSLANTFDTTLNPSICLVNKTKNSQVKTRKQMTQFVKDKDVFVMYFINKNSVTQFEFSF